MDNFILNFLSQGEQLGLDKFLLTICKMLPCYEIFWQLKFCLYCMNLQQKL